MILEITAISHGLVQQVSSMSTRRVFWKRDRNRGSNNDHLVGRESSAEERSWSHIVFNGRLTVPPCYY